MLRGTQWDDTSRLAGTQVGCGVPGAAIPQRRQPRCIVCSWSRTRPSRDRRPRSGPNPAWGAPGGPPRPRPGGRPERNSRGESGHLRRPGEAVPGASSSPHPGHGPPQLSRALGPCRGRGLRPQPRCEGGSLGEHWRGKQGGWGERRLGLGTPSWGDVQARREGVGALLVVPLASALRGNSTEPGLGDLTHFRKAEGKEKRHPHPFVPACRDPTASPFLMRRCTRPPSANPCGRAGRRGCWEGAAGWAFQAFRLRGG